VSVISAVARNRPILSLGVRCGAVAIVSGYPPREGDSGAPVATWVAPPLYQLPENVLSSVLLFGLALVKAHTCR
jgi:hypothetical protein